MFTLKRKPANPVLTLPPFDLGRPLTYFGPADPWTIGDSLEGTQIFGATGSGKTSGSGATIAKTMLREGYGGLVLTTKPDERQLWERYCAETGRTSSLLVFGPNRGQGFNFLDYELNRAGPGGGITENLVSLFMTVLEAAEREPGAKGGIDPYWGRALRQLLRNAIDILVLSVGSVSLPDLARVIATAPQHPDDVRDPAWHSRSFCFECLIQAQSRNLRPQQVSDLEHAAEYWLNEFAAMPDRTRASIVSTFTSMADGFLRGHLRSLFCSQTTVVPELTHHGVILVIDLPVKEFHELGRYAQVLWKYCWQRATEARDARSNPRPVFLWCDEAQNFVTNHDMQFQATARSSRAATVYLTQNISNYYAAMGGGDTRSTTDSLLGNLQTKIFHANGDAVTNEWAERLFAKKWGWRSNLSTSDNRDQNRAEKERKSTSAGITESLESDVLARDFTLLRKGGPANAMQVEAIVFQGGRAWSNGSNAARVSFRQSS